MFCEYDGTLDRERESRGILYKFEEGGTQVSHQTMLSAGFSPSKTLNGSKRQKTEYFSDQKWITEQELEKTMAAMFFYAVVGRV
jgi:hypothetical protein